MAICEACGIDHEKAHQEPELFAAVFDVSFPPKPKVTLVMMNAYKIGRFVERWQREGAPNETRDFKVGKLDLASSIVDSLTGTTSYQVVLYSTDRAAVETGVEKLGSEIDAIKADGYTVETESKPVN